MSTNDKSLSVAIFNSQRDTVVHDRSIRALYAAAVAILREQEAK